MSAVEVDPVVPLLNRRGTPWLSLGRRNLSCVGTSTGNGGVKPPNEYVRRRDGLPPCENNDGWTMHDWRIQIDHALGNGIIDRATHSLMHTMASFSDGKASHIFPSQATIGERANLSAARVCHLLAKARAVGLIDWIHQFDPVRPKLSIPKENVYAFLFQDALVEAAGLTQRLSKIRKQRATTRRPHHRRVTKKDLVQRQNERITMTAEEAERRQRQSQASQVASQYALLADISYQDAVNEIEERLADIGLRDQVEYALDEFAERWKRRSST
jgi:hypothetical protein